MDPRTASVSLLDENDEVLENAHAKSVHVYDQILAVFARGGDAAVDADCTAVRVLIDDSGAIVALCASP